MFRTILLSLATGVLLIGNSFANSLPEEDGIDNNCWVEAGNKYNIDPLLLYAIAGVESDYQSDAVNAANRNKSRDVGLMQINSHWFPTLASHGIEESDLYDPCLNIHVGAWVLAQKITVFGNTWEAVGAYNAGTRLNEKRQRLRLKYATKVFNRYSNLINNSLR